MAILYEATGGGGGHDMIENNSSMISAISAAGSDSTNDDVVSAYGISNWSDTSEQTYVVQGTATGTSPISKTGVGDKTATTTHAGWMPVAELYGINSNQNKHLEFVYDPDTFTTIPVLGGYILDDEVSIPDGSGGTVNGGAICIWFANEISTADTKTGVCGFKIITDRRNIITVTPISA